MSECPTCRAARPMAERALRLDRQPRSPRGGLQVGMSFEVAQRDWFRLLRLARWIVAQVPEPTGRR